LENKTNQNQQKEVKPEVTERFTSRPIQPAGFYSNQAIQNSNRGVRHQFQDSIGGCSANYR